MSTNVSKVFRTFEQRDRVLTGVATEKFITAVAVLPDPAKVEIGSAYLLTKYCRGYIPGIIYILNEVDGERIWMDITVSQIGKLPSPTNFWKRVTKDSIILHWKSAEDVINLTGRWKCATWDYDVIVRKFGSAPESPDDGEVLGYSTVRDQYDDDSDGFIVSIDENDPDFDYHYAVFSCTISNVPTRSEVLRGGWTWDEVKAVIDAGKHHRAFKIGDVIPLPRHKKYGVLHAVIVDFDHAPNSRVEKTDSIVFQIQEVLNHMSFDNAELMYARTTDLVFRKDRKYFLKDIEGHIVNIEVDETPPEDHPAGHASVGDPIVGYRQAHMGETYVSDTFTSDEIPYPTHLENCPVVYVEHPSIALWANNPDHPYELTASMTPAERMSQCSTVCGDSNWRTSNMRRWLTLRLGIDQENYVEDVKLVHDHCAYNECTDGCTHIHSLKHWWKLPKIKIAHFGDVDLSTVIVDSKGPSNIYWTKAQSAEDTVWCTDVNGWFTTTQENWHNVAPGGWQSAEYISQLPFQDGFPVEFTDLIYGHRSTTITDAILWRYIWGDNSSALSIVNTRPVITSDAEKFWLPSVEEVYGFRPSSGHNGDIIPVVNADGVPYSEGTQFAYYKEDISRALKRDTSGVARIWWLRSCDPTTLGRVFCVSNLKDVDGFVYFCSETAHRLLTDEYVGPSPCFIVRAS